jgi:putative DNA primase/helicase
MTLSQPHRDFLHEQAITDDVIERYDIRSVTAPADVPESINRFFVKGPGILFDWRTDDAVVPQFRPDAPVIDDKGNPHKYVFPKDCGTFVGRLRDPLADDTGDVPTYLMVEGTKQVYAAASWAPPEWGVVGIAGCNNWIGADLSWAEDHRVVVLFDSDLTTNRDVHDAAAGLKAALDGMGADEVVFATLTNARSKEGLDDVLGRLAEDKRTRYLQRLVKAAKGTLGRAPKSKANEHPLFSGGEFLALKASEAVLDGQPAALGLGSTIALYRDGCFRMDFGKEPLLESIQRLLGDKYRPGWRTTVEESLVGMLSGMGMRLPEHQTEPVLNVANGMLDLRTGELAPHSPDFLSSVQIPVAWDPTATAPHYESWVTEFCPCQVDDLEESVSVMLDPSRTPTKAVFLFGPSRSGKSTFLRIALSMAGARNTSGVDLHQLAEDRFAAANLYGVMLNSSADVSSAHVTDTSLFKRMTGEDVIQANRKYGAQFAFTNRALFAFSANTLPTVNETSRAYVERIKPFEFPRSFAGAEDPRIEDRIQTELPGILVRWVAAWQRFDARGRYAVGDPVVMKRFETSSNRVALWVSRTCRVHPGAPGRVVGDDEGTGKTALYQAFLRWLEGEGGAGAMKRTAFLGSLESIAGVVEVRLRSRGKNIGLNVVLRPEREWDETDELSFTGSNQPSESVFGVGSVGSEAPSPYVSLSQKGGMDGWGVGEREGYGQGASEPTLPTPATPTTPVDSTPSAGAALPDCADTNEGDTVNDAELPCVVTFDVETPGSDRLMDWDVATEGPWARLCGYSVDGVAPTVTTDVDELLRVLYAADVISAHNGLNYDLIGLARHHGADYERLAAKCDDTLVVVRQLDPPSAKKGNDRTHYDLDSIGTRMVGAGKNGDLGALKNRHGGYHLIPTDDAEYRRYLIQDVQLLNDLRPLLPTSRYLDDERDFLAACGGMTLRGVRLDVPLVTARAAEEEAHKRDALAVLGSEHGLPLREVTERVRITRKEGGTAVGRVAERAAVLTGASSYVCGTEIVHEGDCSHHESYPGSDDDDCTCPTKDVVQGIDPDDYTIERTETIKTYDAPFATTAGRAWVLNLWSRFGVTNPPRTPKGRLSTKVVDMQKIIDNERCPAELRGILDAMNTANGARVVYATLIKNVIDGRYHPRMSPEQASGRLSCGVSVFGKHGGKVRERASFVADEGHLMVAFDYDQVDARAVAAHCQDPAYMDLFEGDQDFHTANSIMVFGDASYREIAKKAGHGENYGMGITGLVKLITGATGKAADEARELAQTYVDAVERAYPIRNEWRARVRAKADRGELLDNGFGRMMRPEVGRGWTQGPALIGQGTTRDIMRRSILDLAPEVRRCLAFTVHDELVFGFPADRVDEYGEEVMRAMTFDWFPAFLPADSRPVHITCGRSKAAASWAGCYA